MMTVVNDHHNDVYSTGQWLHNDMDKLQLTGQNRARIFNSRIGCVRAMLLCCYKAKQPNLKLKTWARQLLGYLLLAFVFPIMVILLFIKSQKFPTLFLLISQGVCTTKLFMAVINEFL
jgi:hypothetical protein